MKIRAYVQLIRLKEWVKNLFVFTPIFFGGELFSFEIVIIGLKGSILFCLLASIVYITNDLKDSDLDRLHHKKRYRPITSGAISKFEAISFLCVFYYYFSVLSSLFNGLGGMGLVANLFVIKPFLFIWFKGKTYYRYYDCCQWL